MTGSDGTIDTTFEQEAFDALVETSFALQTLLTRTAERHALSLTQLRLLGILRDREPTMLELAGFLRIEKSSVSGLIDRAEQRDLVARKPGARDRRTIRVVITPAGRRLGRQILDELAGPRSELLAPLSSRQRSQLTGLLRGLGNLKPER